MPTNSDVVLVVDDNPATRYTTSRVLRAVGLTVVEVANGRDAIDKAMDGPDLIVLDINLPDIDGFQVCRELRARAQTQRTPVIYLSATFVDDVDKVEGVNAGADGYLTHPVEPPVLVATVNAFLRARRAEEAEQQSEAKFKAIFDNALNGISLLSADLIFIDVNPSMCHILGRDRDAIVGRHITAFSTKEQALISPDMTQALEATGAWRGTAPVLNASGALVDLEWSISIHSVPEIRLAIVSDITTRKAAEAERESLLVREQLARAEAEQANRLKDDFLAALSHELRTPLSAIVGFSRVLQLRPIADDPQALACVDAIQRNAQVQAQLISDLLDISRITSGKLDLDRQYLSPADAVQSALSSSQNSAKAKNVTIRLSLDRSIESIWWDPTRFQQVVWNLVDNAVKFSPLGGVVDVRLSQGPSTIDLEVRDQGRGISPAFLPYVFDRFRQENAGSRRSHGGLGLGLAVVYQLVTAHGATITASSDGEGRGASFVLRMPRVSASEAPVRAKTTVAAPAGNLRDVRILVVEDNSDARMLIRGILTDAGAVVRDVPDVASALGALSAFRPDALVSDLGMPDRDGFDLIREVRSLGWSADVLPAIALTAFAREEDRRQVLESGYQSHFTKPLDVDRFVNELRRLLDRKRANG